jgi:hypothetical protein
MLNRSSLPSGGFNQFPSRKISRVAIILCLLLVAALSILYFRQHSMVYHARPYAESYAYALPANEVEINYTVATEKYCAFYIPHTNSSPKRLWLASRLAACKAYLVPRGKIIATRLERSSRIPRRFNGDRHFLDKRLETRVAADWIPHRLIFIKDSDRSRCQATFQP